MMSHNLARDFRTVVRYVFYAWIVLVIVGAIASVFGVFSFLANMPADQGDEFTQLSGEEAKNRRVAWPKGIETGEVRSVSYKSQSSRDSFSTWYRIELTPDAASRLADQLHREQESGATQDPDDSHEGVEGVHRTVAGPPALRDQTGETPSWWTLPSIDFRATELMISYSDYGFGVGRATNTALDKSTGVLWIYQYAAQHDRLWEPGDVPSGRRFSTINSVRSFISPLHDDEAGSDYQSRRN